MRKCFTVFCELAYFTDLRLTPVVRIVSHSVRRMHWPKVPELVQMWLSFVNGVISVSVQAELFHFNVCGRAVVN
jgi:hypothetical protein